MKIYLCGSFTGPITGQMQTLLAVEKSLKENFETKRINFPNKSFFFPIEFLFYTLKLFRFTSSRENKTFYLMLNRTKKSFWLRDFPIFLAIFFSRNKVICHLVGSDIKIFINSLSFIEKEIVKKCLSKITYWIVLGPNMKKQLEDIYQSLNIKNKSLCYSDQALRASIVRGFYSRELNDYIKRRIVEQKIITFGKEPLTIGYLSNLMEEKGIVEFIESIILLREKSNLKINAWIAGGYIGKPSKRVLETMQLAEDKEYIDVCGILIGEEKWNRLSKTNIFILPTYYKTEGLPLSIVEAMAAGCLCISSKIGEIESLLEEKGILIDDVNAENIVNEVESSLNKIDSSKRKIEDSYSFAREEFSFDLYKSKILKIMRKPLLENYD